ncbi:hypothetical protein FACS1894188_10840 [Clostridia bacterium]|nr:hypothetical protein FACS1894188_10840 [Clostridia bacterium]
MGTEDTICTITLNGGLTIDETDFEREHGISGYLVFNDESDKFEFYKVKKADECEYAKRIKNRIEIEPKLLSGEIRVSDIDISSLLKDWNGKVTLRLNIEDAKAIFTK